jgi:hypothetical protein
MLYISIPKPCHEKWNQMSPNEQGAFCKVCSKTVVDFTILNDDEVKNYFLSNHGQKTCGRFRNDQLTDANDPLPRLLADAIPFWKKFLAIVLVVFGSFLTGCKNEMTGKLTIKTAKPSSELLETTLGGITPEQGFELLQKKADTMIEECSATSGITEVVVGDIMIDPVVPIQGEIVESGPDQRIDSIRETILDENGNAIRKKEE